MPCQNRHRRTSPGPRTTTAFTLIEVTVSIGIILLLMAMLIPGLNTARESVRRMTCANNLRQWGTAVGAYRDDYLDYLPTEGTYFRPDKPYTWFNELPPYLDAPRYRDVERIDEAIKEYPALHTWICPSKQMSRRNKSGSGKNQIHYGMNAVLDGMNSKHAPGSFDEGDLPIPARRFAKEPHTVFLFDIYRTDSRGHPKDVATSFHKDYANVLYLAGGVANFRAKDFVTEGDYIAGRVIWTHPLLYWGYRPPAN